ncbi:uncharacterized protein LOC126982603 isoform X1 [Eriocheir sinensis]|uniref:uncharacterized protein LOC126982603 isoform X1 n=1 Tax=Eriocheir sinensis TaxID=95602 RepID=UPI0021C97057|nr:uncharacterized protein LOC126982603 isoform X1 [Eriocheir sinensis]
MNDLARRVLRYVCPAAAVYLVATQVCSSFLKAGEAKRQPGRGGTGPDTPSCRALFTVTDVARRQAANVSLFIHDLQGYSPPHKFSGDWRARAPSGPRAGPVPGPGSSAAAAGAVRQLLLKRNSPSGASTADYSPLAALLPSVLARQAGGEGSVPTVTTTTRIGAAGGLLPYVPCQIATYADPASATACFRERLKMDGTLWTFFMGDSKIRNLFFAFLARTDEELHYVVKYQNMSVPFSALDWKHIKLKQDMDASTEQLPGLLVSYQFRGFSEQSMSKTRRSPEVRQLARWAAGLEAPPHLLVLGYALWTLGKLNGHLHDNLGCLLDVHRVVAPLLQQNGSMAFGAKERIDGKPRVDMEASSAQLPGLRVTFLFKTFSEQALSKIRSSSEVQQLARWAEGLEAPPHLLVLGYSSWGTKKTDFLFLHDALGLLMDMHEVVVPLLQKISWKTRMVVTPESRFKVHIRPSAIQHHSIPYGDPSYEWSETVFLHHLRRHAQHPPPSSHLHEQPVRRNDSQPRDHLVPGAADGGVWWWDTSLPLSLAESSECEELFLSGLAHHPLYKSFFFRCDNDMHAGTVTLGDQVTMLLNLACNSVLEGREGLCCA